MDRAGDRASGKPGDAKRPGFHGALARIGLPYARIRLRRPDIAGQFAPEMLRR